MIEGKSRSATKLLGKSKQVFTGRLSSSKKQRQSTQTEPTTPDIFKLIRKFPCRFAYLSIAVLATIIYANTFFSSFHFDDPIVIGSYGKPDQQVSNFNWRPRSLGHLTFEVNYTLHQENVFGYHLVNHLIHVLAGIFVFQLSWLTFSTPAVKKKFARRHGYWLSLFIALVFITHPLQTQAVTYIVQRFASLVALFYIMAMYWYFKARMEKKNIYYWWAILSFVGALLTKENAVTWPVMVILYEFFFFQNKKLGAWVKKLFLLAPVVGMILVTILRIKTSIIFQPQINYAGRVVTSWTYFLTQSRVIATYLRLIFVPWGQNADYSFQLSQSLGEPKVILGFTLIAIILGWGVFLYKKYRLMSFGIWWFFVTLAVESSFIPINDVIFEHRLYLPMVGFGFFLAEGSYELSQLWFKKEAYSKLKIFMFVLIGCYSLLTISRNWVWRNEVSFWADVVKKSPQNARANNNYGLALDTAGRRTESGQYYLKAAQLAEKYVDPHNNYGNFLSLQGDYQGAIDYYRQALAVDPDRVSTLNNLGVALMDEGQVEEAISELQKALVIDPKFVPAIKNLKKAEAKLAEGETEKEEVQ